MGKDSQVHVTRTCTDVRTHLVQSTVEVKVPPMQGVAVEGSGRGQGYLTAIRDDIMTTPTEAKHNMPVHTSIKL